MPVPNSFANVTTSIPLSQLDANFATPITLGNTAIQLGNTVSTLNNMTLANVTVTSGNVTITNVSVTTANVTNATIGTANVTTANIATEIVTTSQTLSYGTANGVVYLNGSKVSTTGASLTFDGTNFATTGSVTSAGASNSGNLTFTGTGNRITGDFSNGTVANRVMFQTSSSGSNSVISAIPNGAATQASFMAIGNSTPTNASYIQMLANGTTDARIVSSFFGTGTSLPMTFYTGGSERMRVDTSGNVGIGTSSPQNLLHLETSTSLMQRFKHTTASNYVYLGQDSTGDLRFGSDGTVKIYFKSDGGIQSVGGGAIGYGTGAGGTVTQATNKSTAVTLNKPTGQITMNNAALAAGASVTFVLNNTLITTSDMLIAGCVANSSYSVQAISCTTGAATIRVTNITGGSLSEALGINFALIKGATS